MLPGVKGSEPLLRPLFQNLVGNALKYCKHEVTHQVKVGCEVDTSQGR